MLLYPTPLSHARGCSVNKPQRFYSRAIRVLSITVDKINSFCAWTQTAKICIILTQSRMQRRPTHYAPRRGSLGAYCVGSTLWLNIACTRLFSESCRTSERKCNNGRCIAHEIVCNDYNPCGDHSDCPTGLEHLSTLSLAGIIILGILGGGTVIIIAAVCLQQGGRKMIGRTVCITLRCSIICNMLRF